MIDAAIGCKFNILFDCTALLTFYPLIPKAVYGYPEFCGHETIPVDPQYEEGEEEVKVSTYCSRDLIISEDERFDKINAVASLLMEKEIRGNLVVLADEGKGKNRGFLYPLVRGIFLYVRCALISVHQ